MKFSRDAKQWPFVETVTRPENLAEKDKVFDTVICVHEFG